MFTFDPFAIALLLAAMWSFKNATIRKQAKQNLFSGREDRGDVVLSGFPEQHTENSSEEKVPDKSTPSTQMEPKRPSKGKLEKASKQKVADSKDAGRHGDLKWRKK